MKNLFTLLLSLFAFAYAQSDLVITTEVCGPTDASTEVRLTGPFWNWNPTGGPIAVNNGDGTFTFTLSPAPSADMEYLFVLDGVQEDMVASGTASGNWACTPVTDFANYANRQWLTTDPLTLSGLVYGSCDPCTPPSTDLVITTEVCGPTDASTEVRLTGPFWNWNPTGGPIAVNNGDGTFTFTLSPAPSADMEYLFVLDGVQEDMVASGTASGNWACTPVTDFANYANRQWLTTDPLTLSGLVYGSCDPCTPPSTDLVITTEVCGPTDASTEVRLTGPFWNWNPTGGPIAVNNGDGTFTFTLSPAPSADMEYLFVLDGVQEDMVASGTASGNWACTPVTDFANYANRQWLTTDPLTLSGLVYGSCDPCTPPSTDLVITTEVCGPTDASTEVRLTGPFWNWNPTGGPIAVNNGDGTFTFTLSPAPSADMEYLFVLDGVQEDMVASGTASGNWACTPVTDFANYANRQWLTTDPLTLSGLVYGSCDPCTPPSTDLVITTEVCGPTDASTEVRLTGPFWNWNPTGGPIAVNNGDGTFTFTLSPAPSADMEYLFVLDGVQEDMVASGTASGNWACTPVTDFANYANRQWLTTDPLTLSGLVYGSCDPCTPPSTDLVITTEVCGPTDASTEVRLTGPFWNWNPTGGPIAVNNGDGTFTFTLSPAPSADMEYLFVLDGVQEDMVASGTASGNWACTPVTDFANYANRQWLTTDPLTLSGLVYGSCDPCTPPSTDLVITTEVCGPTDASTEVRLTGPFWNWNPTGGPIAVNNGDGTFTFTLSPAPSADMEYLFVLDGVQEDMVASGTASGNWACTPVTDFANYANRQWLTTDPLTLSGLVYGSCDPCQTTPPTAGASPYCGAQVYHFQNPAELASSVYLTVANNGPNSIYVEVESADSDPVDLLIINSATPGYTLGTMTNTGGIYRNDMTWSTQVDSVDINVLWSKQSFGGNWQLSTTNVRVAVTDTCSSTPPSTDLVITTEVCGPTDASTEVRLTGPFWNWNPTGGPIAVNNGDGTFTFTLSPAPSADMEYLFVLDGVQEDMVASGTASGNWACTPVTDFANYANRQWLTTDPLTLSGLVYGSCDPCSGPTNPCLGVLPDTMILDDFECQKNINYTFANATWNSVTANPNPSGINTSANVGQFIHWGVGTDGAFGGDLDLAPIDLAVYGYQFKMDLHPSASGLPVTVVLQDGSGSDILAQTASTTVANEWETLSYDFSAVTTPASKIVFVVAPGDTVQHEIYFDNIRLDTSAFVSPCAGIVPDTSVFDDFECQTNVTYTFANATWTEGVINPNPSGINTSSRVGEFIHWGAGTDGAFGGDLNLAPIDLVYYGVELNMDVHPSAIGLPITVVLQDAGGADLDVQTVTTTVAGEWETLTYDFGSVSDVASKVVFVVAPGDSTQHVVYFDNIKLDPSTALATCPGVAPDVNIVEDFDCQRNADYTAVDGSVAVIANPDASGINTSANVGEYTRGNGSDDEIAVDFELAPLDFNANNQMKMDVWDADVPSTIEITLLDNAGIVLTTASATTSVGNAWEQLSFDFQDVPPTSNVSKAILSFDAGSLVDSNKVYYFDNWKMDGLISGIRGANVGSIALYPNPAKDKITLDLTKLSGSDELQVQFIAVDGRLVAESSYIDFASKETIDVSSLSKGIYIVEIRTAESKWLTKFIKE